MSHNCEPFCNLGVCKSPSRCKPADQCTADDVVELRNEIDRLESLFQRTHGVHSSWVQELSDAYRVLEKAAERLGYPYYLPSSENRSGWLVRISDSIDRSYGRPRQ